MFENYPISSGLTTLASCCFVYYSTLAIYRYAFHPLARFPGPRLAGLTYWYEFYYDVICRGRYLWKIKELHEQYGPIIRINPHELHINDPEFYDEIYHSKVNRKTDRDNWYMYGFGGQALAFTRDHDLHIKRREAFGPYFSHKSVALLSPRIANVVEDLMDLLARAKETGETVIVHYAMLSVSTDVVSDYAVGRKSDLLRRPDLGAQWSELNKTNLQVHPVFRQFPVLFRIMNSLPQSWVLALNPDLRLFFAITDNARESVERVAKEKQQNHTRPGSERTVFHDLLDSKHLSEADRSISRLADEALVVLGAGGETTGRVLNYIVFQLINNPMVLERVREELKSVMPDPRAVPPLAALEKLPYLSAVIEECLRLCHPVTARGQRVFHSVLQYREWEIPPGTPVGQCTYMVQTNPTIFPEPTSFRPERWLDNKALSRYRVTFSKGRRACLGINLAYAEMYMTIGAMFRRFDFEFVDTTERDVEVVHDFFIGLPALDSKGVTVRVVKEFTE